ncbi:hypothetical protein EBS40_08235 [bacterium]|nr:hypothetical protein [bacterium]
MKQAITIYYAGDEKDITFTGKTACLKAYRWLIKNMIVGVTCKFSHSRYGSIKYSEMREIARIEKSENE